MQILRYIQSFFSLFESICFLLPVGIHLPDLNSNFSIPFFLLFLFPKKITIFRLHTQLIGHSINQSSDVQFKNIKNNIKISKKPIHFAVIDFNSNSKYLSELSYFAIKFIYEAFVCSFDLVVFLLIDWYLIT